MDEDEDDDEWVEPTKLSTNNRRRHRDKNSPRRQKNSHHSKQSASSYPTSGKGDIYLVSGPDGTVTPPSSYDMLSMEERSNLLASMCGVITTGAKKIWGIPILVDTGRRNFFSDKFPIWAMQLGYVITWLLIQKIHFLVAGTFYGFP